MRPRFGLFLGVFLLLAGCRKPQPASVRAEEPRVVVTTHAADITPVRPRVAQAVETIEVPNDRPVLVVLGGDRQRAIVHLHGRCLDPRDDLDAWGSSVSALGTIISLAGELEDCPEQPGMNRWAADVAALDARIRAAVEAVATTKHIDLDANHPVLIGASMGATRAMQLAHRYAGKYTELILIGAPEAPVANDLAGVRRVALLAGENEDQTPMRGGASALSSTGIRAQFWELPEATHGIFGPEGATRMGEAARFVTETE